MAASALRSRCACSQNHHCCANSSKQDSVGSRFTKHRISIMESTGSLIGRCHYPQESRVYPGSARNASNTHLIFAAGPGLRIYGQPAEVTLAVNVARVFSGVSDLPP